MGLELRQCPPAVQFVIVLQRVEQIAHAYAPLRTCFKRLAGNLFGCYFLHPPPQVLFGCLLICAAAWLAYLFAVAHERNPIPIATKKNASIASHLTPPFRCRYS